MSPTANTVKPSGDISLSDTNTPTSPSKADFAGYSLRSGLKAVFTTPALKHPIPDISLSDATLEGSGLFQNEDVAPLGKKNKSVTESLPSKEQVSEAVSKGAEKTKKTTERAVSPVKNKSEAALDSAANAALSTAGSALQTAENKTAETVAYAKRKAEGSIDYAKYVADDGIKYAKQKTGMGEHSVTSNVREGIEEVKDEARKGVAEVKTKAANARPSSPVKSPIVKEQAPASKARPSSPVKSPVVKENAGASNARPSSPVKSHVVKEHPGVLESLAGSAKNLAEKFSHAIHHPLGGDQLHPSTGAPTSTPVASFRAPSPTKSAPASTVPEIPSASGQKVHGYLTDEDIILM